MKLICFPWAGSSGALYNPWLTQQRLSSFFQSIHPIDYPGRASRSDEKSISNVEDLVKNIVEQNRCFHSNDSEAVVLFGHSFGAIIAFQVAKLLQQRGRAPLAVFVSASVPPSNTPLVKTRVSQLDAAGVCEYFASKGNPVSDNIVNSPELLELFLSNVKADYTCLETFVSHEDKLSGETQLIVIGGELDPGVKMQDLKNWGKHWEPIREDDKGEMLILKVFEKQGHFYLNNTGTLADLGEFIVDTIVSILAEVSCNVSDESQADYLKIKENVAEAFRKALGCSDDETIPEDAHFFNELGGTSLDTMVLTAYLQRTTEVRVTQNEFFLHPTLCTLSKRITELKASATNAPTLDPIDPKDGTEWFPASAGQEQMMTLWESAPAMYNMPTTVEFHGNLLVDKLKQALIHVVSQQEGLRTIVRFDMMENKVVQKVLPPTSSEDCLEFVQFDATDEEEARLIVERESVFVFDLTKAPVIRAVLVKTPTTHLLLLNQHHVGSDGWSRTQQRRQILKAYLAFKNGNNAETIPPHPSYLDWTMYTRNLLYNYGQKDKQLKYWRRKLKDLPVLDLPLDHKRPLVLSSRGFRIPVKISSSLVSQFSSLMAMAKSNLFVGLLSLYMSLLHIWGGGEKFAIGVAMANRQHEGLEHLVGYFANEVAIVADFKDDPNFLYLVQSIRENVLDAMENSDVPFHEVCEALKIARDSSRTSLFQAMFALQEREWHNVDDLSPKNGEDDVTFNLKQYNHNTSKFEVHLQLRHDGQGGLEGDFHIATDLFTKQTGERLVQAFNILMEACIENPGSPVISHSVLPEVDLKVIKRSNSTSKQFKAVSIWDDIQSADNYAVAFQVRDTSVHDTTYKDFKENAKCVARFLTSPDTNVNATTKCVGILVRNSPEGITMVIGVHLAHFTAVIVDIEKTPVERIKTIFDDAEVRTVLVVEKNEPEVLSLLESDLSVFSWDEALQFGKRADDIDITSNLPTNHPFAIYYTSGTTGLPKGVVIELQNVMNLRSWWSEYFKVNKSDKFLLFSSLSFIMSLRQWLPPLMRGATIVIPKNAVEFEDAIVASRVNKLICTPSALATLDIQKIHKLDSIQVAGEPPQMRTMIAWRKKTEQLHIGLGPTELCAHALCGEFDGQTLCIGYPAANVRAYVVNKFGVQLPLNVVGELWIAGSNVANGYLNRDAENEKHFSTDSLSENYGDQRLYKTGDLCRRLADGRIQFVGRRDKQIKLNGYRIEIGDIQNAMPLNVKNCHIFVNNSVLTACITPKLDETDIGFIRSKLKEKLPSYMVPAIIHSVEEFPLNRNKKIDTVTLTTMLSTHAVAALSISSNTYESRVVKVIKTVWAEVLGTDVNSLNSDDNFFGIGGTSLSAVILSRKLTKEFTHNVSVQDVFRYQTICSFEEYIRGITESRVGKVIKMAWAEVLGVSVTALFMDDNFFSVGGTSLSAVILSRKLTKELGCTISVQDVFRYQTIASFEEHIMEISDNVFSGIPEPLTYIKGGERVMKSFSFTVLQILGIALMAVLVAVPLLATTFISVRTLIWFGYSGIALFPAFVVLGCMGHMSLVLLCKWAIMGSFQQGKVKVFSWYFLKWWLVRRIIHVSTLYTWIFDETALSSLWMQMLGAKVGKNTYVEQPYILEPDLVTIGSNSVVEFETQISTSEIKKGIIEFRRVTVGDNVKLGVRSVLLGGSNVPNGCEVQPKANITADTKSSPYKVISGSPAHVVGDVAEGKVWRKRQGFAYTLVQFVGVLVILFVMALVAFAGASIGLYLQAKHGSYALVAYLGAVFSTLSSVLFLALVAIIHYFIIILPGLKPEKKYSGQLFFLRKWFMDRIFLSPMFRYASQRTLQTSSTFPWYLKLLGAKVRKRAWMNHPYFRVGVNLIDFGTDIHMGMHNYITSERYHDDGALSFCPVFLSNHVSVGQRCVFLSGSSVGDHATIGAETAIAENYRVEDRGSAFGCPPVQFNSSLSHENRVKETQELSMVLDDHANKQGSLTRAISFRIERNTPSKSKSSKKKIARRQDVGKELFWSYVVIMLTLQAFIPIAIGGSYAGLYYVATFILNEVTFQQVILVSPVVYLLGSFVLMAILKLIQVIGGGYSVGTSNFFSFSFLFWHILADMVYFCTSTVLYPISGTQIYCIWMRFMGAKVGKNVFISPENGGFREIDFMNIGDYCVLLTPNIHAHYTDHGQLQFCPIVLEQNVEVNFGATIMPLTQYKRGCCLRPHAVTVKGQLCEERVEYFGNPCKPSQIVHEHAVIMFPGQGSQYPGMIENTKHLNVVQEIFNTANTILGYDVLGKCGLNVDPENLKDTKYAQPLMFIAGLAHAELMKEKHPAIFSKVKAVAGFSLGEITALAYTRAVSLEDSLRLVSVRANAMAKCNGGAMCNVTGLALKKVQSLCKRFGCSVANIICNHHDDELVKSNIFVCAGKENEISSLIDAVNVSPHGKAKKLRVSGAFHSKHMLLAQREVTEVLANITITLPTDVLIFSNVTGRPYRSASEIRHNLSQHILKAVKWHDTIQYLRQEENVTTFLECGPMNVLSKTVNAILKDKSCDVECSNDISTIFSDV